jgi:tetratricopeptide (TPR) repeat protein
MEMLGSLVESSLVGAETRADEPRFSLLETIRDYALERLAGGGWMQAHDRHAAYFQALAEPSGIELAGPGQLPWVGRLETEHDDLLAAMSWLVNQGHIDQATHLFLMSWRFCWLRGHLAELARLGDDIAADSEDLPPYQHALALTGPGFILIANGDLARAQTIFEQSLPLYRQTSGKLGVILNATVLAVLGHLAAIRRDYAGASELLDEGQALLRELREDDLADYDRLQHLLTVAFVDNFLGQVRLSQADNDAAARLFTDGLAVARCAQDGIPILISLYNLGLSSQAQGDLAGAAGHLREGLAIAAETGDETSAAYYLEALAAVAGQQDNPQRAVRLLAAARSQLEASGSGWLHAYVPRAPHDDAVLAALRARIGDAAYQEARAWGGSIGSRHARQYALE